MPQHIRLGDDPAAKTPEVRAADGAIVGRSTAKDKAAPPAAPAPPPEDQGDAAPAPATDPEEVLFRCEAAPDLRQYLPSGRLAQFQGQFFRTKDASLAAELRGLIADPRLTVMFVEEDVEPVLECPYCPDFTSTSYRDLKAHIRAEHKGRRIPALRDLV